MEPKIPKLSRYARQVILPEIGARGQSKIQSASVLCIGAGGLGSPAALYLAAAGIGRIGIVDSDRVEISNLHRQVLHCTSGVGNPKAESARERLTALNPEVQINTYPVKLSAQNAFEIASAYDVVIDGSDNFPTRYLVNDTCVLLGKVNCYGSVLQFEGQASVFAPHLGAPCYRCLYPEPPGPGMVPSCAEGGVLGVLPGIIGLIQATEALKIIGGFGTPLLNRLLLFDALATRFREIKLRRDPLCPVCGTNRSITQLIDYEQFCGIRQPGYEIMNPDEVSVQDMKRALDNPALGIKLIDVREPDEQKIAAVPGVPLLPLSQLPQRFKELNPEQEYYLYCKGGGRSLKAVQFLRQQGFRKVKSVAGGINAWSNQIDPSIPTY
jgi:sulfur-carrier protein adenylyltransferase/sulfurtransferase